MRPFLGTTLAFAVCVLSACMPAGPKALLDGKESLDDGDPAHAVKRLETAASLMPTNGQVFNYLGLAYHMAGQVTNAQKAYHRAVQLNPDLSEARYNLGCLYLEVNRLDAAKGEFTAYTLRLPKAPRGWIKLGTAQYRARDYANAERSFNEALRLSPGDAEALNSLGLVRLQRGRLAEARQSFETALQADPNYPAAMLNLAVIHQQNLKDTAKALALYKRYSVLKPSPPRANEVNTIIQQLETAFAPAPPVSAIAAAPLPPVSNAPATVRSNVTLPVSSSPPVLAAQPPVQRPLTVQSAATNGVRNLPLGTPVLRTTTGTVRIATSALPPPAKSPAVPQPNIPAETVVLSDEPQVRSAFDPVTAFPVRNTGTAVTPAVTSLSPATSASRNDSPQATAAQPDQRRGFLRKLNPLNLLPDKKKDDAPVYPVAVPKPHPQTQPEPEREKERQKIAAAPSVPSFSRYPYRSPGVLRAGDRPAAERAFRAASAALKAQRPSEAALSLRSAAQLDPSYFEAHYNLGVVLTQAGDAPGALAAYENALEVRPRSPDARYNFALLLKQSGYALDAANELENLLTTDPNEARAHLAAGNIYAEQLRQPARARTHYQRFLELDPRNSQAGTVRYWLTTKPAGE